MAEKEAKVKEGARIMKCTCKHEFQDQLYGKGMRVHNCNKEGECYCTVCAPNYRLIRMDPNNKDSKKRHAKKVA